MFLLMFLQKKKLIFLIIFHFTFGSILAREEIPSECSFVK